MQLDRSKEKCRQNTLYITLLIVKGLYFKLYFTSIGFESTVLNVYKILNIFTNISEKRITASERPRDICVQFLVKNYKTKNKIHSNLHKGVLLSLDLAVF